MSGSDDGHGSRSGHCHLPLPSDDVPSGEGAASASGGFDRLQELHHRFRKISSISDGQQPGAPSF